MVFIDTHAHLNDEAFAADLDEVISAALSVGAKRLLLPATDLQSAMQVAKIADKYKECFPMLGLHPEDLNPEKAKELDELEKLLVSGHPFIAIGEVGLDYYWDSSYADLQKQVFRTQVEWSVKYKLPLMIHCRKAHNDLLAVLSVFPKEKLSGVFHCFSGTEEEAEQLLDYPGFCLGIGGIVTFKKSLLPQVLSNSVPLERIVLETDCPYMAPVPHRGKRNEPSFIPFIAAKLAEIYGVTTEYVMEVTTKNAEYIFPDINP